jgi:hypothetical protein
MSIRKPQPSIEPGSSEPLASRVRRAIRDEKTARDIRVALRVGGGLPEQAYHFEFLAEGSGAAHGELRCQLSDRSVRKRTRSLDPRRFRSLLRRIDESRILQRRADEPRFLPDTVIGLLEVASEGTTERIYFAADPDQASVQNKVPSAALQGVVDAFYAEGARLLGVRNVKP